MSQFPIEPGNRMPAIHHEAPIATGTTTSPAGGRVVTQEMLAELDELQRLLRRRKELVHQVRSLLDAGAPIEPGPLTAHVVEAEQRRFNIANLTALLGDEAVEWMKTQIAPTTCRSLRIVHRNVENDVTLEVLRARSTAAPRSPRRNMDDHMIHPEPRTRTRRRNSTR